MRTHFHSLIYNLSTIAFIIIVIGSYVIVAQNAITGEWKADTRSEKQEQEIHLSFERRTEHGRNQNGTTYSYSDLEGLTLAQTENGKVNFRLVREAGTIACEGAFVNGRGRGTFVFTPDPAFVAGMQSRGYRLSDEKQFASATLNLTLAFVDDLRSAGFGELSVDDLFKARIFNVTPQFMAEMRSTGFPNMGLEDLVKARIFKIDADYARQVRAMGFDDKDFESLVKFRIFNITPEYLAELKAEGFSSLSAEDVVKFRIFKIDPEFIRSAKAEEPDVTVEDLVQMKIGVRRRKNSD